MIRPNRAAATLIAVVAALPAAAHDDPLAHVAAFFADANVVSGPELVDCTLSGGTETTCFSITVKPDPQDYTPGPWCPTNIADDAEAGGIWIVDGEANDVDGAFITRLAEIYGDTEWKLYDEATGDVRYTGTLEACEAAARPDVDPAYNNYCVQCLPEYLPEEASVTYVIPLRPVMLDEPADSTRGGAGVAYNGVRLDGPAPLEAITSAHTIAPFDDCGGHVNTHVGYHYHAVTDCLNTPPASTTALKNHGTQIGIAMDGFPIMGHIEGIEDELDACNGIMIDGVGYHYYAGAPGSNAILGCHVAEVGCTLEEGGTCNASLDARRGPPPGANGDRPAPPPPAD
ncbi:YHYH protein [Salipiger sp. 1_MG-2023]|uniref:YHYH protein n=1 Tax=Salipiger sp. 1_MG-2023 TaxID=3062665 RepID=UPI0026E450EC|nr:YHYH protein [Salipiger sp. 1_MG-2023]MDO6584773.1 YHYH protein [Salipiger sp. 1_MG-2023]